MGKGKPRAAMEAWSAPAPPKGRAKGKHYAPTVVGNASGPAPAQPTYTQWQGSQSSGDPRGPAPSQPTSPQWPTYPQWQGSTETAVLLVTTGTTVHRRQWQPGTDSSA